MLIISDVWRGVTDWEFTTSADKFEDEQINHDINKYMETNTGMIKQLYGNIMFSIVVCTSSLIVIFLLFIRNERFFCQESILWGSNK